MTLLSPFVDLIGLTVGLKVKKVFFTALWLVNQTDRHFKVWMVVRFDGTEWMKPIWLNSLTILVAVFRLHRHITDNSTLEAMNCPGCRTAEKFFFDTLVSSITAILRKVWKHIRRLISWHSSDKYAYCSSLSMTLYLMFVYFITVKFFEKEVRRSCPTSSEDKT